MILRMRSVPAMDETAMHSLENVYQICRKRNSQLIFSHVNEQPMSVLKKHGFLELLGEENFCKNIDEALAHAKKMRQEQSGSLRIS